MMKFSLSEHPWPGKNQIYVRENARGECTCGFDDAAIAHDLLDTEGGEHARHYDPDEGVGHPAAGADASPKAEGVINGRVNARVYIGSDKALRLECEGIGEEPVVVQDCPERKSARQLRELDDADGQREHAPCVSENDGVLREEVAIVEVILH